MHFYVCFSRTIMTNGLPFNAEGDWYLSLVILNSYSFFSVENYLERNSYVATRYS